MSHDDAVIARLDTLQTTVETLIRGLGLLCETMETHSEMLGNIMEALTVEPGESDLGETLDRLVAAVDRQTDVIASVDEGLQHLVPAIEEAVVRGVRGAAS